MMINSQKNCFLCDVRLQSAHIRDIDQLFYDPKLASHHQQQQQQFYLKSPLATILTDVLEQRIHENNVHSKVVCRKCQEQCRNYEILNAQLQQIRQNIQNNFNGTANKYQLNKMRMDLVEQSFEAIETNNDHDDEDEGGGGSGGGGGGNDSDIPNMYTIESVDSAIGEVFEHENNIMSNTNLVIKNPTKINKVMLIKAASTAATAKSVPNPFFSISHMGTNIDDDQTIHAVLLDDMNETTDFGDSATNTNDGLSGESDPDQPDASEQYIMTEHLEDSKEYFEANGVRGGGGGDQIIEISTNGDSMTDANYQYVFQDDDSVDEPDDDDDEDENDSDMPNVPKDDLSFDATEYLKADGDGTITFAVKSFSAGMASAETATTAKKIDTTAAFDHSKQLFTRIGAFNQFHCSLCQPTSTVIYDPKTISIHLKTDHNERIYVCSICGLHFRKRNPYNEHMERDHMDQHMAATASGGTYECEECHETFADSRQFRLHNKTHTASVKIWPCKACKKKYNSKNLLDEHMNMHTGARPYKCPHCVKDFASKYTLTAHMKIHNDRKRPFQCTDCGKSFFSNQNLTQHVRTHTGVKEYECDDPSCGKKFGSQHNLDVHKIVHSGYKPFICRTCGKAFARRAEIKDHERTHTGERPYKCDLCEKSFAQRSNLMSHKRATHFNDKRYKCDTCERSFKRRRLLEYHIKATHTGERPFKCEQCTATFVYPEHFKKHTRIHTGVKPFACEKCGKTFASRDNRNAHRFIHTEKKPYECMVCHLSFMRKPLLIAHMRLQQHGDDEFIHNKPDFQEGKDNNNLRTITNATAEDEDANIYYFSVNEKFEDDDEEDGDDDENDDVDDGIDEDGHFVHALKEEDIVDESEIIEEDGELITDQQFEMNDSNDPTTNNKQYHLIRRQELSAIYDTMYDDNDDVDHDDDDEDDDNGDPIRTKNVNTVTYITETTDADGDNVSWIGLSS